MKRRDFLKQLGAGAAVAAGLTACAREQDAAGPAVHTGGQRFRWKMVTTWPPNFPGLGTGANYFAEQIERMSGGRIEVKVYGAGELVPAFEVFDAVSSGTAELGHGAAYYWKGKAEAAQFFGAVPFGMNAKEMDGWLFYGGGMELWRELYAPFDLIPFPCGNTGVQMGGWFNREIGSLADLEGLKMRIPGLGGEVLARAGGTPVNLPGSELFTALQTGAIDATEWVGPYNDLAFGLHRAARYYYYPGWHEPNATLEAIVNRQAWEALPEDLQHVVRCAAEAAHLQMLSEYSGRNPRALATLVDEHGVQLRAFPQPVLDRLQQLSTELLEELAARDPSSRKVYDSYRGFQRAAGHFHQVTEMAYMSARAGA